MCGRKWEKYGKHSINSNGEESEFAVMIEVGVMIENAIQYVKRIFADDCSGHDYHHTM